MLYYYVRRKHRPALSASAGRRSMRRELILDILDEHYPEEKAERQFATAVDWGRYAELEFDADGGLLRLT